MRRILGAAAIATMTGLAGAAFAGVVGPDDVNFEDGAVAASLTGKPGNAEEGRKVFANRKLGNCLACHQNEDLRAEPFHGEVGPMMDGAADRWSEAELRGIVVNSKMMFEGTIMPSFYRSVNGARPLEKFEGKTILTAEQVEDIVAYLLTLKE